MQRASVPSGVARAVDESLAEPAARAVLGLRAAGEEFARGLRQAGVDATGAFPIYGPWQLRFRMGARQAFSVQARDGSIRASSWLVGTGASLRLTPPEASAYVGLAGHLDWVRMQFIGEPRPGALAMARAGTGFLTSLGVLGAIKVSSFAQFETEFDAGAVAKGVSARDGGRDVVAMNGPWAARTGSTPLTPNCADTGPNYCHFDMSQSTNFAADLTTALKEIIREAIQCSVKIPPPITGGIPDPTKINVIYEENVNVTTGQPTQQWLIGQADPSCQSGNNDGWYLDPNDPSGETLVLCPATCKAVQADENAVLSVRQGCKSVPPPIN